MTLPKSWNAIEYEGYDAEGHPLTMTVAPNIARSRWQRLLPRRLRSGRTKKPRPSKGNLEGIRR